MRVVPVSTVDKVLDESVTAATLRVRPDKGKERQTTTCQTE